MKAAILHVSTVHAPFDNRIFGMEAKSLAASGFDVSLATTVEREEVREGVRVLPLGAIGNLSRRSERIGRNRRAFALMRRPYDIVHIHDPELLLSAAIAQRIFGRTIVYDVHEFYDEKFGGGDVTADWIPRPLLATVRKAYACMEAWVLPRAGGVVVVSEAMVARYRRYLPDERIAVVQNYPNLTEDDVTQALRASAPLSVPYIVHTGGASKNRSFDVMVEAAELLRKRGVAAPVVNLGPIQLEGYSESEQRALRSRASAAGIMMLGSVPHAEVLRWIAHARVGYLPIADNENNRRGQPRKLFEYLLFGLPVVAADVGKIGSAVREPGAGITVPPRDAAAHAAAITELLDDSRRHAACAENARRIAHGLSFRSQLPRLVGLYERILRTAQRPAVAAAV